MKRVIIICKNKEFSLKILCIAGRLVDWRPGELFICELYFLSNSKKSNYWIKLKTLDVTLITNGLEMILLKEFCKNFNWQFGIFDCCKQKSKNLQICQVKSNLSAAFDTLDAEILIQKMEVYGFSKLTRNWFKSFLTNRSQKVKIGCQGKVAWFATYYYSSYSDLFYFLYFQILFVSRWFNSL